MKPKENYADVIRSLRTCAGIDPKTEGCEGCIYETSDCHSGRMLISRAACVIEDLCELCQKLHNGRSSERPCGSGDRDLRPEDSDTCGGGRRKR